MNQDENKYISSSSENTNENTVEALNSTELDFNKEKRENYENLMANSSTNLDGYWDRKNPFVRFILFILAAIIIGGILYFVIMMGS